ncbi:MAG: carboxymuconolactone decarboxylase family protein [Gammaproteobacteria bacterium]|jgi:alkylhydroperoxidase/carboxymuconolactone decarboxylase family protein YurZ|nr:carboxymuconolactone decarboxylase family protein [Gammaproteobacteria bacterium]
MARPEEAQAVKTFREAKTGKEKVHSWGAQSPGRNMDGLYQTLELFADKAPWIIDNYAHDPLADIMDRGVLDRKSREMIFIGMMLVMREPGGVVAHVANGLAAGLTKEEIIAIAELACYEGGKVMAVACSDMLSQAFEACKDVTVYEPNA